jgi:hypothetical protein
LPAGGDAAANNLSHASALSLAAQAAVTLASVANIDIVGVCMLLIGSAIVEPQPPVSRLTRFGTLPAAMRSWSDCARIAVPSRNRLCIRTEAMVVNSLTTILPSGTAPSTVMNAIAGSSLPPLAALKATRSRAEAPRA